MFAVSTLNQPPLKSSTIKLLLRPVASQTFELYVNALVHLKQRLRFIASRFIHWLLMRCCDGELDPDDDAFPPASFRTGGNASQKWFRSAVKACTGLTARRTRRATSKNTYQERLDQLYQDFIETILGPQTSAAGPRNNDPTVPIERASPLIDQVAKETQKDLSNMIVFNLRRRLIQLMTLMILEHASFDGDDDGLTRSKMKVIAERLTDLFFSYGSDVDAADETMVHRRDDDGLREKWQALLEEKLPPEGRTWTCLKDKLLGFYDDLSARAKHFFKPNVPPPEEETTSSDPPLFPSSTAQRCFEKKNELAFLMMHRFIQCKFREHLNSIEAKEARAPSSSASSSSTAAAGKIPRAYRQEWKLSMVASPRAPHVTLSVSVLKETEGLRHACEDFVNEVELEETTSMMPGKAYVGLLEQCKRHFRCRYLNLKESEPPGDLFASLVQHLQRRKRSKKEGPTTKEAADVSAPCAMPNSSSSTSTSSMDEADHPDPKRGQRTRLGQRVTSSSPAHMDSTSPAPRRPGHSGSSRPPTSTTKKEMNRSGHQKADDRRKRRASRRKHWRAQGAASRGRSRPIRGLSGAVGGEQPSSEMSLVFDCLPGLESHPLLRCMQRKGRFLFQGRRDHIEGEPISRLGSISSDGVSLHIMFQAEIMKEEAARGAKGGTGVFKLNKHRGTWQEGVGKDEKSRNPPEELKTGDLLISIDPGQRDLATAVVTLCGQEGKLHHKTHRLSAGRIRAESYRWICAKKANSALRCVGVPCMSSVCSC